MTPATGHPGTQHTYQLLKKKVAQHASQHQPFHTILHSLCPVEGSLHTHSPLIGKLMPLPTLTSYCSRFHQFQGNTAFMLIIDWFSKTLCLIPLPSPSKIFYTTELLFTHISRYFGIHKDIVHNRVPIKLFGVEHWQHKCKNTPGLLVWRLLC